MLTACQLENEEKETIWNEILTSVSTTEAPIEAKVIVIGDDEKSIIYECLSQQKRIQSCYQNTCAIACSVAETALGDVSVYQLSSHVEFKQLLNVILPINDVSEYSSMVIITLDCSKPHEFMNSLEKWFKIIQDHVQSSSISIESLRNDFEQEWKKYQLYFNQMESDLGEINIGINPILEKETLIHSIGINISIVCVNSDKFLDSVNKIKSPQMFDYILTSLRCTCLKYGASLFTVSINLPESIINFNSYMLSRLFNPISKNARSFNGKIKNLEAHPNYLDGKNIYIPAGWDSVSKIKASVSEGFIFNNEHLYFDQKDMKLAVEAYNSKFNCKTINQDAKFDIEVSALDEQEWLKQMSQEKSKIPVVEKRDLMEDVTQRLKIKNASKDGSQNEKMLAADLNKRLLFAVPKKGRLFEKVSTLLNGADIQFSRKNRLDIALSTNLPLAIVFLPAADIAKYVAEGNIDIGITGQDVVAESNANVEELLNLGFGKCQLCIQVPKDSGIKSAKDLIGKRIVTSFETLAKRYFYALEQDKSEIDASNSISNSDFSETQLFSCLKTQISYVNGSVEAACALGLADGIIDLVESGETMRAANLHSISVILSTETVLICNRDKFKSNPLITTILKRIKGVIAAQKYVYINYNASRDILEQVKKITPGRKAPTISPLEDDGWVAVSAMVLKDQVADIMDQLSMLGAKDILVFSLDNCRV